MENFSVFQQQKLDKKNQVRGAFLRLKVKTALIPGKVEEMINFNFRHQKVFFFWVYLDFDC